MRSAGRSSVLGIRAVLQYGFRVGWKRAYDSDCDLRSVRGTFLESESYLGAQHGWCSRCVCYLLTGDGATGHGRSISSTVARPLRKQPGNLV